MRAELIFAAPAAGLPPVRLAPGVAAAHQRLTATGASDAELADLVVERDGMSGLPALYYHLEILAAAGMLSCRIDHDGSPLVIAEPLPRSILPLPQLHDDQTLRLSRFVFGRRHGDTWILESARSDVSVALIDQRVAGVVAQLARPCRLGALVVTPTDCVVRAVLALLVATELVGETEESGHLAEDLDETLVAWEFHDLLFHTRSRLGGRRAAIGATYPLAGVIAAAPAVKPPTSDQPIALPASDLSALRSMSLAQALDQRRSRRQHGKDPITVKQLGAFLFHAARASSPRTVDVGERAHEITRRPSPSGGASHSLEIYVVAHACTGLARAIYHYDPLAHALYNVSTAQPIIDGLLADAQVAVGQPERPQVLIILGARFRRLSWKYSGIAYATVLKDLGALMQTMYLVATGMDLAACALGAGNSELFARAVGTEWAAESSVGEFILGSHATADAELQ